MAEVKTKVTEASVAGFLDAIADSQIRKDCKTIADMMQAATKAKPKMWGAAIVGFGQRNVVYAGGREAPWMLTGFAPRKQNIVLYLGGLDQQKELLAKLGTHAGGKGCLYIKRLSDVRLPVLKKLVGATVRERVKTDSPAGR
jgi:hypothetical protein